MNPYKILEDNPTLVKKGLQLQIETIIKSLTHISLNYDDIESEFFKEPRSKDNSLDKYVEAIYKEYAIGFINLYGCFLETNINEMNLNTYTDRIIELQGLSDSRYYNGHEVLDKIIKVMSYFDNKEGRSHIRGYSLGSEKFSNFRVSPGVGECFMVLGFLTVKYLNRAMEIIEDEEYEDKNIGQALLIEALYMWIKIANVLRIDINRVINEFINNEDI